MIYLSKLVDSTGTVDVTNKIQEILNLNEDTIIFDKGIFLVSNLYLNNNSHIIIDSIIKGTNDESKYDLIDTRVAGINMKWYPAIINAIDKSNIIIEGNGTILGAGEYFYNKYWGPDAKGGMRKTYDKIGLRWACDYDCKRVRNLLIQKCNNITIKNIESKDSGFWNVHILYSNNILIDGVKINSSSLNGPSTDGIDIDSSYDVIVKNVETNCNDDSICIKSGRDYDGYITNIACHDIKITDCVINKGFGITIGSEISAGVYNIDISNIKYNGTDCAFRIKSSNPRGGYIKDIYVNNLDCINVKYLFHLYLNWNPNYSTCVIPSDYKGKIEDYWITLTKQIENNPKTKVSNLFISNINSKYTNDYNDISRVFNIVGYDNCHMNNIIFNNINAYAKEYGVIEYVDNLKLNNFKITATSDHNKNNDVYDNR